MNKIKNIFIIDTETSGLNGYPVDIIFEIGICELKIDTGEIIPIYDQIIGYEESQLSDNQKNAWIFENSTLSLDQIINSNKKPEKVAIEVRQLVDQKYVAFYNLDYDHEKFMKYEPYLLEDGNNCLLLPCIMKELTPICKIKNQFRPGYKWPKLDEAQDILFNEKEIEEFKYKLDRHRAISDAYVSAKLLFKLISEFNFLENITLKRSFT